jgi:hypothetical protein
MLFVFFTDCLLLFSIFQVLESLVSSSGGLLVIVSSQFIEGGSCRTQLTLLVNLNTATHSRSKSLLMVFGARVVIARQPRIAEGGIKTLRYNPRDGKREECLLLKRSILLGLFSVVSSSFSAE